MILYDEEISIDESSNDDGLTYEDIYNAVYNGYMDAYTEIKISESEENALVEETTPQEVQRVYVDNFPSIQTVKVNNLNSIDLSSVTDAIENENSVVEEDNNLVDFSSSTDARLYTCQTSSAVDSIDAQSLTYLLDIRNLLLLFLLVWFSIYIIRMIKKTIIKFMKGRNENE